MWYGTCTTIVQYIYNNLIYSQDNTEESVLSETRIIDYELYVHL